MAHVEKGARRPHVVIVGAGFAGLSAAKGLSRAPFDVTVVDRHNYHLFQPLLYQVATAGLSPADIASPIRSILRRQDNTKVVLANVSGCRPRAQRSRRGGPANCIRPFDRGDRSGTRILRS